MRSMLRFFLEQKLVVALLGMLLVGWGIAVAPFDWKVDWLPRDPVPVDAIPDRGENQQIVFTEWEGRSPNDVQNQVTYPLTTALLGVPGVREIRSQSMLGFSSIFVIFEEDVEFYWSRTRLLEKLGSLQAGTLPAGVQPVLGPDATGLGQIFWYTLEGRNPSGEPVGGWDLQELRTIQDWYVRFGLQAAVGVSEVASIGGHVNEYHVEVDPEKMRIYDVTLGQVMEAVRGSNIDVGAGVTEINRVEYVIRGVGFIKELEDLEKAVVGLGEDRVPILVKDVAVVGRGSGERRGVLTTGGAEAVGGVVVVREGFNPLEALRNVNAKIDELGPGMPVKAVVAWEKVDLVEVEDFAAAHGLEVPAVDGGLEQEGWQAWLRDNAEEDWPEWLTLSRVSIEPFYDRTQLIYETLGTLNDALVQQILVTIIVVLVLVLHLRAALVISALLPVSVLTAFIMMKLVGIDANVVALAGIAIAIGTIVDMGIIVTENVMRHLREADAGEPRGEVVLRGAGEVGSAVLTAISTTIVSFLPVFTMTGAEGKTFIPLAYTKTFVLIAAIFITLTILPAVIHLLMARRWDVRWMRKWLWFGLGSVGVVVFVVGVAQGVPVLWIAALVLVLIAMYRLGVSIWRPRLPDGVRGFALSPWVVRVVRVLPLVVVVGVVAWVLADVWEPLGPERGLLRNFLFVVLLFGILLGGFYFIFIVYERVLRLCLEHKLVFLMLPMGVMLFGLISWLGVERVFRFVPVAVEKLGGEEEWVTQSRPWVWATHEFDGLGRQFLPDFDEGAFLWMPTTMPHASLGEALEVLKYQDQAIESVPEVERVIGKIGRAESALDPAPISMVESVILYKSEFVTDEAGRRVNFRYDRAEGEFVRDGDGELIPDADGHPYRQWREHIQSPRDIWDEIVEAAELPGTTSATPLQPIETRIVMLQTGMRTSMGMKLRGPDLETLNVVALRMEEVLREAPGIDAGTVNAERVVGKPYLEFAPDRELIARHGLSVAEVMEVLSTAVGGSIVTWTVEGRERFPVRVRYPREQRNTIEDLEGVLVDTADGARVPMRELGEVEFVRGPQMIRSEDTFLTTYVTFGGLAGFAEVDVVEAAQEYLQAKIAAGELEIPDGVSWRFAGDYEHQLRAAKTLSVVLPLSLMIIFLILYLQFRRVATTFIVFSSIAVAWGGGFTMLYWYGQPWFLDFSVFGVNMREMFQLGTVNLSVAVWVGFLALFGIAVDDSVVMATYLKQSYKRRQPGTVAEVREAAVAAGLRRVRPCLMTTATTILALLPVLTSTGRGSDLMIPMALPSIGGMFFVLLSLVSVPVLYSWLEERKVGREAEPGV